MKAKRYHYEYRDGKHGFSDSRKMNGHHWQDTFFESENRARQWIAEKNREEGREF